MRTRQYEGSRDHGHDPALQLVSRSGLGELLCLTPSAFLLHKTALNKDVSPISAW